MADTYRSGPVTITVDQRAVLATLNKLFDGAGSRFTAQADRYLRVIERDARALAPVRSGTFRDSFKRAVIIASDGIAVTLSNDAPYGTKVRFARHVKGEVPASVQARAQQYAERATTPESKTAIIEHVYRRNRRRIAGGAPTEALRGKHAWTELVRKPFERGYGKFIDQVEADLLRLAGELS